MSKQKTVLITVGTTQFEGLIKSTDKPNFVQLLAKCGYSKIIYQVGKGQYKPIHGTSFTLSNDINHYYKNADLIICHGGAGTLLQNLYQQKLMISISNEELLGNHQVQIIKKLDEQGYILGFSSIRQFENNFEKVKAYLNKGPTKIYKRPEKSLINQLIFEN